VPDQRRRGCGRNLVLAAAAWARSSDATLLALAVTAANRPARALYASLGFEAVGEYHYRIRPREGGAEP
jgi:ribosomal protein S18 acetylase RimI-like enzyme